MKNIAIITGASSGIGEEFVNQLKSKDGIDEFWLIARREEKLKSLGEKLKINYKAISLDLEKEESFEKFKELLSLEKPNIKILVNSSGFGKFGSYEDIELKDELRMINLNVKAPVAITELSLPYMTEGAKILQICSIAGFHPIPYLNVYASTKAFFLNYSRALNYELKNRKITVTAVCPGWTKTAFFDVAKDSASSSAITRYTGMRSAEEIVKKAIKRSEKNKDTAVLGLQNNTHRLIAKLLPYSLIMRVWDKIRK